MKRLQGRVAAITGAGSGIGRALAERLADKGCVVALCDVDEAGLAETTEAVRAKGGRASSHVVDVARREDVERFASEVEKEHGAAHVLVNNAGVSVAKTFEDHSYADLDWIFGVNLWGVVHGCKAFLPMLRAADEAHIVNISSVFGLVGVPMNSTYCASKFAVRGFSEALRVELEEASIGVTSVHPGGIATNIVSRARWGDDQRTQGAKEQTVRAFEGMLPPSEAARVIVRGIEDNAPKVLITSQAHALDALLRVSPRLVRELVRRRWAKYVKTGALDL